MRLVPSRRQLLLGVAGILGTGAAASWASLIACNRRALATAAARQQLVVVLDDIPAAARLARTWSGRTLPEEVLLDMVLSKSDLAAAVNAGCPDTRRSLAARQMRADFQNGDFMVVDRLVVSKSECLVAALCLGRNRTPPARSA